MRKLRIFEHVSLDGVIQHSVDENDFSYSDWTGHYRTLAGRDALDGPDLILWGSSTLTSPLLEHGLADEVLLVVYPVLLGKGKRIFTEGTPPRSFEFVSTKALASGVMISTYKPNGPLRTMGG